MSASDTKTEPAIPAAEPVPDVKREPPTEPLRGEEWWRVLLLSITRNQVLSDHLGDAWGGLGEALKLAGLGDIPTSEDDFPSLEALDAMGARGFWGSNTMPPKSDDDPDAEATAAATVAAHRVLTARAERAARCEPPSEPVVWVDGRAEVGGVTLIASWVMECRRLLAVEIRSSDDGFIGRIRHPDEATAKRLALAVARALAETGRTP